jgi:large subunit ribosomal protein L28e
MLLFVHQAALARASAVISAQQPVKAKNLRPAKGVRAEKKAAL